MSSFTRLEPTSSSYRCYVADNYSMQYPRSRNGMANSPTELGGRPECIHMRAREHLDSLLGEILRTSFTALVSLDSGA